jgi:hypothetical protein
MFSFTKGNFRPPSASRFAFLVTVFHIMSAGAGRADEGLGSFKHLATPAEPSLDQWGPVPTDKLSVANVAPGLILFFNNNYVFGLPGTVTGRLADRTQLSGDWGGARTDLTRRGVFIDAYSTTGYQNVTWGGLATGGATVQNTQLSINIDTGRAGLWQGGLLHFTVQSRYGAPPARTFTVGAYTPQYVGLVLPGPLLENETLPSEYFLTQAITKKFSMVVGVISDIYIPDETLFGNNYRNYFTNFALNKNPMTTNFYHPTSLALLGAFVPMPSLVVGGGVLNPNTVSDNIGKSRFTGVNIFLTAIKSYEFNNLPGQFSPSLNWSNQPLLNLNDPYGSLPPSQIPSAVGELVGVPSNLPLPRHFVHNSGFLIANISQYVFVKDAPALAAWKLKSGQPLDGVGVFTRMGHAPQETNRVTWDASVAVIAVGMLDQRRLDSVGVGYFTNVFSSKLKDEVSRLTLGRSNVANESGLEAFYNFAITPAINVAPSYQHIWDPFTAHVVNHARGADVFIARLNVNL